MRHDDGHHQLDDTLVEEEERYHAAARKTRPALADSQPDATGIALSKPHSLRPSTTPALPPLGDHHTSAHAGGGARCHHDESGKGKAKPAQPSHEMSEWPASSPFRDLSAPSSAMTGRRGALGWNDPRPCASPVTGQRQGALRIVKGKKARPREQDGFADDFRLRAVEPYC